MYEKNYVDFEMMQTARPYVREILRGWIKMLLFRHDLKEIHFLVGSWIIDRVDLDQGHIKWPNALSLGS
jgi:hypothetical protein